MRGRGQRRSQEREDRRWVLTRGGHRIKVSLIGIVLLAFNSALHFSIPRLRSKESNSDPVQPASVGLGKCWSCTAIMKVATELHAPKVATGLQGYTPHGTNVRELKKTLLLINIEDKLIPCATTAL